MTPRVPQWFAKRLRAIDPDLRVEWLSQLASGEGRWAIYQKLWNTPSIESSVVAEARDLQKRMLEDGYVLDRDECERMIYPAVVRHGLVFIVEEPDHGYRDLDERTLARCREAAWLRRHWSADDWEKSLQAQEYEARRAMALRREDIATTLRKDATFKQMMSDKAAGLSFRYTSGGPLPAQTGA